MLLRFVAVLLLLAAAGQTACENWELKAYRGIAAANIAYERSFSTIVALHAQGRLSDQSYAQAKAVATRLHTFLEKGTGLMVTYQAIKSDATRAEVQAILNQLPILLGQISALVSAATAPPAADFEEQLARRLRPVTTRLDRLDAISLEAAQ